MPAKGWIAWIQSALLRRKRRAENPPTAIDRADNYLAARIRRRQLVSRAPSYSAITRLDNHGEPFMVLDVVMALGERMSAKDRRRVFARLMKVQRNNAWAYSSRTGIDSDSTAAAIRSLDRLGKHVPLDGLARFFNPETNLYHTFHDKGFADRALGLQFPPHTFKKHQGAHPCVLANVYSLLWERRELLSLDRRFLQAVQKPDGCWASYYYPSPYYATRIYTELLTSMGSEYDEYTRRTLIGLLAAEIPTSVTQIAEVLLCLACLQRRFPAESAAIAAKSNMMLRELSAAQMQDGSWPSDIIWESMMEDGSVEWAHDHFRVRSTALAIRALQAWNDPECVE
jgi:hypothetical protein